MRGQVVLLLHGINRSGEWQDRAREVLEPHFRCEIVRYLDYRLFGATKIYVWPWSFLFFAALLWSSPAWLVACFVGCASLFLIAGQSAYYTGRWWPLVTIYASLLLGDLAHLARVQWGTGGAAVESILLGGSVFILGCIFFCEFQRRPRSWIAIALGVVLEAAGLLLYLCFGTPWDNLVAWLTPAILVTLLEQREYSSGANHRFVSYPFLVPLVTGLLWWWSLFLPLAPGIVATFALLVYALKEPWFRQERMVQKFHTRVSEVTRTHDSPHLIAHSFGTLLTGSLLTRFTDVRVDRIILLGCVLDEAFDWPPLLQTARRAASAVRNEHGDADLVVLLAGWMRNAANFVRSRTPGLQWIRVPRGLGLSGRNGFRGGIEHNIPKDWAECNFCQPSLISPVHNVRLVDFGHSTWDHSDINEHARQLWLPFLWRIVPDEYRVLLDLCEKGDRFDTAPKHLLGLRLVREELEARTWYWPALPSDMTVPWPGRPLVWYAHELLPDTLRELPAYIRDSGLPAPDKTRLLNHALIQKLNTIQLAGDEIPDAIVAMFEKAILPRLWLVFCHVIAEGRAAYDAEAGPARSNRLCWLFPPIGFGEAITKTLLSSPPLLN